MNVAERIQHGATKPLAVVRCLGRFGLQDAARDQLQVRTRKARALLAALAFSGRPMSRDSLAALLWSDRGGAQARASLRQTIFELQHFSSGDEAILVVGRDDVAVDHEHLVTDMELIRRAAGGGDWPRLLALLEDCEPGLLTDLDGLDQEFDDWLRLQRAQEPARTLAATVDSAERCRAEAGPRAALDLVSEILRLDPVNEEATRLALRIDHELGDNRALHHHYQMLCGRLRDDYDAEPSAETAELFRQLSDGSVPRLRGEPENAARPAPRGRLGWRRAVVPSMILAAALALLALLFMREREAPSAASEPILIAVLPFDQQPSGDRFLAEGLWEDTRAAISRNSGLRVLGRATSREVAGRKLAPGQYRSGLGVDYLLEGNVRRSGDQVLVSVALTRTSDGVAIWEDSFRSRLGDPIALQEAIAAGIEGKLRGRLARGGGRRAEQIATTPESYALYSEARALLRTREIASARRAQALLRRALAIDPNFAPAWSTLGKSIWFSDWAAVQDNQALDEASRAVRRALALAPNLAEAHGTAALLEGGNDVAIERHVRRALALDPSNTEAWNWLGNALTGQSYYAESVQAYRRAVELDPLWFPPVHNLAARASEVDDKATLEWLFDKIADAGAGRELVDTTRAEALRLSGDYSGALKLLVDLSRDSGRKPTASTILGWCEILARLGYYDEVARLADFGDWYGPVQRSERLPPTVIDGKTVNPTDFWGSSFFPSYAGRAMVNLGRSEDLVRLYRKAFRNPDEFISKSGKGEPMTFLAPTLAVALRSTGEAAEADYILSAAARRIEAGLRRAPGSREALSQIAFVRGAQGDRRTALAALSVAVERGWLPDGLRQAPDIAQEPAFRELRGHPRFEAARKRILDHIARERAELGPLKI